MGVLEMRDRTRVVGVFTGGLLKLIFGVVSNLKQVQKSSTLLVYTELENQL